jgi:type I restriction enzyme S subunit
MRDCSCDAKTWEQRELVSCLSLLKDGTHGTHQDVDNGVFLLSAKNIKNGKLEIDPKQERKISYKDFNLIHKNFMLQPNDVLLTIVGTIGECCKLNSADGLTFQRSVAYLRPTQNLTSDFLLAQIKNSSFQKQLKNKQSVSAQPGIYLGDLASISIKIPKQEEQILVGSLFEKLDSLITLHQRKCESLQSIKKSLLGKMFPKTGELIPEIRFNGFSDAWEQRELSEVSQRHDNLRVPIAENLRIKGPTPYYGANGIQGFVEGFTHEGEFVLIAEDGANDLIDYPIRCVYGKIWVNNHAHIIQANPLVACNPFLAYSLKKADIASVIVGGGRAKLTASDLMRLRVSITTKSEQAKIGCLFKSLESLITLHQRKRDKLKLLKKALLEKMFV